MDKDRPPDLPALVSALAEENVKYVVSGSVAALFRGVQVVPGDFDIVPARDSENLESLFEVLRKIDAKPKSFGRWMIKEDGEKKWIDEGATPQQIAAWRPIVGQQETWDHLMPSKHGRLDVVPELTGKYEDLLPRAEPVEQFGQKIWLASIEDLLARLTVPRREKDRARVKALRAIQLRS